LFKSSKSSWPWPAAALASQPAGVSGRKGFDRGVGEEEDEGNSRGCSPAAEKNRDGRNPADGGRLGDCLRRRRSSGRQATGSCKADSPRRADRRSGAGLVRRPPLVMNRMAERRRRRSVRPPLRGMRCCARTERRGSGGNARW
jgi:hypothetical protein